MTIAGHVSSETGIEQVQAPKMADLVAQQLRRQIVRGTLRDGDVLPTETDLMAQFGVSRPTLREALRVLESEQLIMIRRGARGGARVRIPTADVAARHVGLALQLRGTTLADVLGARTLIEQHCARLLAMKHTAKDLERLWVEVEHGEALIDQPDQFIRVHTRFHALVVELAGSETFDILSGLLREIVDAGNYNRISEDQVPSSLRRATHKGARAHRLLVEHIEAGEVEQSEELWRKHLVDADRYLTGGSAKTVLDVMDYL